MEMIREVRFYETGERKKRERERQLNTLKKCVLGKENTSARAQVLQHGLQIEKQINKNHNNWQEGHCCESV